MNNGNNNQNNFNDSFNDDAFNVFNQNAENFHKQQEEKRALEEKLREEQQHPKKVVQPVAQENTTTTNETPTTPNNKDKGKIDLNDLSTLPATPKKKEEKTPEQTEATKKKQEILLLVVLVVVLGVCIFWAYNVFFVERAQGVNETEQVLLGKNAIKKIEPKSYTCQEDLTKINNYAIPLQDKLIIGTSSYNTTYQTENDLISNINEEIKLSYNNISDDENTELQNYCYQFNQIENNYQLKCEYEYNTLHLYNNYEVTSLQSKEIKSNNFNITLSADRNTEINSLLKTEKENNATCNQNIIDYK